MQPSRNIEILPFFVFLALLATSLAAAPLSFSSEELRAAVAHTERGQKVRLTGIEQEGVRSASSSFALERFEIFTDDATITVHGPGGRQRVLPRPQNAYLDRKSVV